jgi:hypothetical protein
MECVPESERDGTLKVGGNLAVSESKRFLMNLLGKVSDFGTLRVLEEDRIPDLKSGKRNERSQARWPLRR